MKRCVEDVKRAVTNLVVGELNLFERRFLVNDDERAGVRRGAKRVVHKSSSQHLIGREELCDLPHIAARQAEHSATTDVKTGGIGKNGRFHRELSGIGERSNLFNVLIVSLCECSLRIWSPIVIDHALDIARRNGRKPQRSQVAKKGHRNTRLIAIGVSDYHAGLISLGLEKGAKQRI